MSRQAFRDLVASSRGRLIVYLCLASLVLLVILAWKLFCKPPSPPLACDLQGLQADYEARRAALVDRAALPFVDDTMRDRETELDRLSFDEINWGVVGPRLLDNPNGWSVVARTGGRPFMSFDQVWIGCTPWAFDPLSFTLSSETNITPITLTNHFNAGKRINRFWFTHQASNGYPIVVVMTPDGFFNIGGAMAPTLQGAAARIGFIGEPFSPTDDHVQHVDQINVVEIDDDTMIVAYDVHSEAGEGTLQVELHWNAETERPELHFRTAHVSRLDARLGFTGFDFMRGPTLSGLVSEPATPEGGIEAFHDGRVVFLVNQNGAITRSLLVAPVLTTTVVRQDLGTNVAVGASLVMDQPQNVAEYMSKHPYPGYDQRTDLVLDLTASSTPGVSVRRAQKAVDLAAENPEADETVNVFYAAEMIPGTLYDFAFTLGVAAEDFGQLYTARRQGVVFRSDRAESHAKLYFMPLGHDLLPSGPAEPLTDGVITDPHRPAASADGRFVIFDADDYEPLDPTLDDLQRIYVVDLGNAAVRRLSADPLGDSQDVDASLNGDGSQFVLITDRIETRRMDIERIAVGLGVAETGTGDSIAPASAADWSHTRDEIVFVTSMGASLMLYDIQAKITTVLVNRPGITTPAFSPDGDEIVYGAGSGLYVVDRSGTNETQVLDDSNHAAWTYATWADENRLVVQRTTGGTTDLYLVDIRTGEQVQLTRDAGDNTEPVFVRAVGPTIWIETPDSDAQVSGEIHVAGFVASSGVPTVTVDGQVAAVDGDQWSTTLALASGTHTLTAVVTDGATGLSAQDSVTITVGHGGTDLRGLWRKKAYS